MMLRDRLDQELIDSYAFFIVDQWGVLHNGRDPIDGAQSAMQKLVESGKAVVTLSNSSRNYARTRVNLRRMGFEHNRHYHQIVTSGSDFIRCFQEKNEAFYQHLVEPCYVFSYVGEYELIEELGIRQTDDMTQAGFILCKGIAAGLDYYEPLLQTALDRQIPMICVNPDQWSLQPDNSLQPCPGAIATRYEQLGGFVRWHGKPRPEAYASCFELLQREHHIDRRVCKGLAIGDSIAHDIRGGDKAGLDTLLIADGIHRSEIVLDPRDQQTNRDLFARFEVAPTFIMKQLRL